MREYLGTGEEVMTSGLHEFGLLTDVPEVLWRGMARAVSGPPRRPGGPGFTGPAKPSRRLDDAYELMRRDALRLVRGALDGELAEVARDPSCCEPWSCLAAALVTPGVGERSAQVLAAVDAPGLRRLSSRPTTPASYICLALASELQESA